MGGLALLALVAAAATASPSRLPPVEQCGEDPSFVSFRSTLDSAVQRQDSEALLALMDERVRLTFGGRMGREQLRASLSKPEEGEKLWRELSEVLRLGCAVKGEARVFPSLFVQGDGLDGFETWIAKPGARLRAKPSPKSPVIARLSWHVLTETDSWDGGEWIAVRTNDGRRGHVHQSVVRSLIDYRLFAERRDGEWRIIYFIAGD